MKKKIKVSAKFWQSCNDNEKAYIQQYALRIGLMDCKRVISEARKQLKEKYVHVGAYAVNMDGRTLYFTGEDTRQFKSFE